jgi:hypothetical protein
MQNVTWVIDFRRRAPVDTVGSGDPIKALELVQRRRRSSRKMFATTRALLAEARAVLQARTAGAAGTGRRPRAGSARSRRRVPDLH